MFWYKKAERYFKERNIKYQPAFSNGLDLRNKYVHGTQTMEKKEQEQLYYTFLRVLVLIVIKIKEEFCLTDIEKNLSHPWHGLMAMEELADWLCLKNVYEIERGYLLDICRTAQDKFKKYLDYFKINYEEQEEKH